MPHPDVYVSNSTYFFASMTQMLFLPGDHTLKAKVAVQISNVTNFAMKGIGETAFGVHGYFELVSTISCVGQTGFRFSNINGLEIQRLTFTHCEQTVVGSELHGALVLDSIANLTIFGIMVHNSKGYGLHTSRRFGYSYIANSTFLLNKGTFQYSGGNACFVYRNCVSNDKKNGSTLNHHNSCMVTTIQHMVLMQVE